MNITDSDPSEIEKAIDWNGKKSEETRLEQVWIDRGYIRIQFKVEGKNSRIKCSLYDINISIKNHSDPMPYRVIAARDPIRNNKG